jgi:ABC-2 type transport system ATP-binding protein
MSEIKLKHITKDYGNNRGVFDINFEIYKGEIFGFVGTNGSGKTTTIRQIMGFLKPNIGSIDVKKLDAYRDATEAKKYIGYVPGEIAFPDLPSGTAFIESQAEFLKLKNLDYANELVKILQIDLRANPRKMSKGMKQKTAIIAALMNDPDILLLDEPTTGLDPLMRKKFLEVLKIEKSKKKTILISSHIFEELETLCDRVALIKDGKIIDIAVMDEIKNPKQREYKIEFLTETSYKNFLKEQVRIVKTKPEQNQVYVKVDLVNVNMFLQMLSHYQIKFIAENKYNLEKYFREKFNREREEE